MALGVPAESPAARRRKRTPVRIPVGRAGRRAGSRRRPHDAAAVADVPHQLGRPGVDLGVRLLRSLARYSVRYRPTGRWLPRILLTVRDLAAGCQTRGSARVRRPVVDGAASRAGRPRRPRRTRAGALRPVVEQLGQPAPEAARRRGLGKVGRRAPAGPAPCCLSAATASRSGARRGGAAPRSGGEAGAGTPASSCR